MALDTGIPAGMTVLAKTFRPVRLIGILHFPVDSGVGWAAFFCPPIKVSATDKSRGQKSVALIILMVGCGGCATLIHPTCFFVTNTVNYFCPKMKGAEIRSQNS